MYMFQQTKGNARIYKVQLKDDIAYRFAVERSKRIMGKPRKENIAYIGTVRKSEISEKAHDFWKKADAVIEDLFRRNELFFWDKSKIAKGFEKIIPRPAVSTALANQQANLERLKTLGIDLE